MKGSELERLLKKNGCYLFEEGGNHEKWYSPITKGLFPVTRHEGKEVPTGTVNKILKDAGIKR